MIETTIIDEILDHECFKDNSIHDMLRLVIPEKFNSFIDTPVDIIDLQNIDLLITEAAENLTNAWELLYAFKTRKTLESENKEKV